MANNKAYVDPSWWARPELRDALHDRDIRAIYRFLTARGFSQTRIGNLTGQSQTEVWEILSRGREVLAYEVFIRIADGLGIPRGLMGLAHTQDVAIERDDTVETKGGHVKRRDFLGLAAKMTIGAGLTSADLAVLATPTGASPIPDHIGMSDVLRVQDVAGGLAAQDKAFGGGSCRDAIIGFLDWATRLRHATMTDDTRRALDTTLAELECLAGWTSYDMRLHDSAEHFYLRSIHSARLAQEPALAANALNHLGMVYSKDGHYGDALQAYHLAHMAVVETDSPRISVRLHLSEAQLHARRGNTSGTENALGHAFDGYARIDGPEPVLRARMISDGDMHLMTAEAYSDLAAKHEDYATRAIDEALKAAQLWQPSYAPALMMTKATLALNYYRCGDTATANELTAQVLATVPAVSSRRDATGLRPLAAAAAAYEHDSTANDLAHQLQARTS